MLCFVAWRLVQVLRRRGDFQFPDLDKIKAKGVSLVRNQLLEHPEHAGVDGHFDQHLVVTDQGPVLIDDGGGPPPGNRARRAD